eukprot:TRINITY_DN31579_c0_g1_i1.p1 TRINITY_DN31579_c0_g1~~TRINITY_DN31579_c0_g1_i1.p1  ORF type:complete len:192 (-),score=24.39 TRINITY_DN31579_c0_g1_i1:302-850(-)
MEFDANLNEELISLTSNVYDKVGTMVDMFGDYSVETCKSIFMRYVCDYFYSPCDENCTPMHQCQSLCLDLYAYCAPRLDLFDTGDFKPFLPGGGLSNMFDLSLAPEMKRIVLAVLYKFFNECTIYTPLDTPMADISLDPKCYNPNDQVVAYTKSCNTYDYVLPEDAICYSQEVCDNCYCPAE